MPNSVSEYNRIVTEMAETFERKNHDYGDSFRKHGAIGTLIRLSDKLDRAINISKSGIHLVEDESFEDTCLDAANYLILTVINNRMRHARASGKND